mgnify:CR=1 FL=1
MELISADELTDRVFGKIGTPKRDAMEAQLAREVRAHEVARAIKRARLERNMTQDELGEKIGVRKAQICKLESGKCSPTMNTIIRVFEALGVPATLDLGEDKVKLA